MKITLINNSPIKLAYIAARTCKKDIDPSDIEIPEEKEVNRLLRKCIKLGHESVLEHIHYTFSIHGITRSCANQLTRHRIASHSQTSLRYTKSPKAVPTKDYMDPMLIDPKFGSKSIDESSAAQIQKYKGLLADKVRPEDARSVLPLNTSTNLVSTFNWRSLDNFLHLRLKKDAQYEIRMMADKMLDLVFEAHPAIWIHMREWQNRNLGSPDDK